MLAHGMIIIMMKEAAPALAVHGDVDCGCFLSRLLRLLPARMRDDLQTLSCGGVYSSAVPKALALIEAGVQGLGRLPPADADSRRSKATAAQSDRYPRRRGRAAPPPAVRRRETATEA